MKMTGRTLFQAYLAFGGGANFDGKKRGTFDREYGIQTFSHHQEVIRELIERDKNYACVVMWNIANEPDGCGEGAFEYFEPLFALAHRQDPQKRPVSIASAQMAGGPDTDVSARLSDVICLNRYYGWYEGGPNLLEPAQWLRRELAEWEKLGKPLMITEYGGTIRSWMNIPSWSVNMRGILRILPPDRE